MANPSAMVTLTSVAKAPQTKHANRKLNPMLAASFDSKKPKKILCSLCPSINRIQKKILDRLYSILSNFLLLLIFFQVSFFIQIKTKSRFFISTNISVIAFWSNLSEFYLIYLQALYIRFDAYIGQCIVRIDTLQLNFINTIFYKYILYAEEPPW